MKKLLLLLIIPFLSFGQEWIQTYGQGSGYYAIQRNDDGYAFIGDYASNGYFNISDENGNMIAQQILDDDYPLRLNCIQQTSDNGYIMVGTHYDFNGGETYTYGNVYKFNDNGNLEWSISNEQVGRHYIEQTNDGQFITIGTNSLTKISSSGDILWSNPTNSGNEVHQTNDGGYIIASEGYDCAGLCIGKVTKTNSGGETQWVYYYDIDISGSISGGDTSPSVQQTADMGYIAIIDYSYQYFGNGMMGTYIVKLNSDGVQEWIQDINSTTMNFMPKRIRVTDDGGYVVAGSAWQEDVLGDEKGFIWVMKADSNGEEQWSQFFYDSESCFGGWAESVEQTSDGGYIIAGWLDCEGFFGQNLMMKINEYGNITSTIEIPTINKNLITTVDILGRETNNKGFQLHIYDDGSVEKKYVIK